MKNPISSINRKHRIFLGTADTLVGLLQWRAQHQPSKHAYTFLMDGEVDAIEWSYDQLDHAARLIAGRLRNFADKGDRALILHPPGLDYIAAFFGCLYAGVIAVPAYPPRVNNRPMPRLQAIVTDAQAKVALTTTRILKSVERRFEQAPELNTLHWLATDAMKFDEQESGWVETSVAPSDLAFFQYTSGSTAAPKGVMLTHNNLMHNLGLIHDYFESGDDEHGVIWLPPYHDMGLIGGILGPLYRGFPVTLMSPVAFLQKPVRWLRSISEMKATQSGGPNFAYDLCVDKITPDQRQGLDLSSWGVAFNGAEPVRAKTIQRFTEAFAPFGFREEAFYPTYGMAEATLLISGSVKAEPPRTLIVDRAELAHRRVVTAVAAGRSTQNLVGCGRILGDQIVCIVDPEFKRTLADGEIGEVWVASPSIAQGYWNQPEATEQNMRAYLAENGTETFLRTGDLGFMLAGELYITGRLKDLIIIRGRNHYPHDIEQTVADCHPGFARDGGAAFAVEVADEERLVLVQEMRREYRKTPINELVQAARQAIAAHHGLDLFALVLLKPLRIPRTSSGKIKRHACRAGYLQGTLDPMGTWTADQHLEMNNEHLPIGSDRMMRSSQPSVPETQPQTTKSATEIQTWLVNRLAQQLKLPLAQIKRTLPFDSFGLDSLVAIELSGELGRWLGRDLPGNLLLEHDTIAALADYLGGGAEMQGRRRDSVTPAPPLTLSAPPTSQTAHPYTEYVNPFLGELLEQFKMDKRFVRAEGCWLWDEEGERYLDFIAMYGALPFGFNHPEIWNAVNEVAQEMAPSFAQPSMLDAAGELAKRLIELAPPNLKYVTFANSGAEAVEAAIKLARAATGKQGILSTDNSFHGKTLGALSATGRPYYQQPFGAPVTGFTQLPFGDLAALARKLSQEGAEIAAFIVEPIQGEGGIVIPPLGYLAGVRDLCSRYDVLMIVDEIQTGLGRTGHLFVCEAERVKPDVLIVAKALGGGLMPIGAVLCSESVYVEEFAIKHTSTFAANTLACRVGLRALALLTQDNQALLWQVAENGAYLKTELEKLQGRFPTILTAVRGRGYMLGLEFNANRSVYGRQCLLGPMAEQEILTAVIASYMLNVEKIRVAPTLNGNSVLRLEPPLIADRAMCDRVLSALSRVLTILVAGNTARLMAHLVGRDDIEALPDPPKSKPIPAIEIEPQANDGRFAFLVHPLTPRSYVDFDASLAAFSDDELADLTRRWQGAVEPFVVGSTRITSKNGETAYGDFIGVPFTADELMAMSQAEAAAELRRGVELAKERGARIVGLGSYTSIASQNGRLLVDADIPLTTGNSYTVVATAEAIEALAIKRGLILAEASIAIIGATGSIGRATALRLADRVGRLILIGNPAHPAQSLKRLGALAEAMAGELAPTNGLGPAQMWQKWESEGRLLLTTDIDQFLPQADVVVTATSSTQTLLKPAHLKPVAIVCDTSQPANMGEAVRAARPDVLVMEGGIIAVPGQPDLGWEFGLEPGHAFACMAETMILALERRYRHGSLGLDLDAEFLGDIGRLARKHGFEVEVEG